VGGGTAQRLAVDRDRPSLPIVMATSGTVPQPGANHPGQRLGVKPAKRAADGGLGRDREVAGERVAVGAERGPDRLGGIGGPLGDRDHRAGTGQDRGRRQPQDGDQGVAAAAAGPGVGDGGQVGEQARWFGWSEWTGLAQRREPRRDRG